ncbi:MAG TPA: hypothetical protein VJR89_34485 [Polyangiales bacterium]|nr:hypothetical protein [Polyangiales bacterium]
MLDTLHATGNDLADGERVTLALCAGEQMREGRVGFLLLAFGPARSGTGLTTLACRGDFAARTAVLTLATPAALALLGATRCFVARARGFGVLAVFTVVAFIAVVAFVLAFAFVACQRRGLA